MPTFLQPVALPERCYLEEVLYWVAFQRLPVVAFTYDGQDYGNLDSHRQAEIIRSLSIERGYARQQKPPII